MTGPAAGDQEEVLRAVPDTPTGGTDAPRRGTAAPIPAAESPERWRQVRAVLTASRQELSHLAASLYPDLPRVGATDLLSRAEWLPGAPLSLDDLPLTWVERPPPPVVDASGPASAHIRPVREAGRRYASYADAVAGLDRPALFENRPSYRLLGAALAGPPALRLALTSYFEGMELGHSVAHELAVIEREDVPGIRQHPGHRRLVRGHGLHRLWVVGGQVQRDRGAAAAAEDVPTGEPVLVQHRDRVRALAGHRDRGRAARQPAPRVAPPVVGQHRVLVGQEALSQLAAAFTDAARWVQPSEGRAQPG